MNSASVLEIFKEITTVPRESGHEAPMTAYLQNWAKARNLECKTDKTGNVLIVKEASEGKENVPAIVLQGHQDMVCEKNAGVEFDFSKDPINYVIENGWMVAKDTTLGADDGIGVAAALALLESDAPCGRIECLFTISEETGMDGAMALEEGFFTGKTLINLDSEDEGQMFVGCAGGMNTSATFKYENEAVNDGWDVVKLSIKGAAGGHSGDDINKCRMNTVRELCIFLKDELANGLQLISFDGGGKTNTIARDSEAVVAVPDAAALGVRFGKYAAAECPNYPEDPEVCFKAEKARSFAAVDSKTAKAFIESMCSCVHGVIAMSSDIADLVETSNNLASAHMKEGNTILVLTSQRSSITSEVTKTGDAVGDNFAAAGAEIAHFNRYPGWKPNMDSKILDVCVEQYRKLFGKDPEVKAIHAGLECGLFLDKFPGLDMISFGPTLRGVHTPGERMDLASLDKFVRHLEAVVCNFR